MLQKKRVLFETKLRKNKLYSLETDKLSKMHLKKNGLCAILILKILKIKTFVNSLLSKSLSFFSQEKQNHKFPKDLMVKILQLFYQFLQ